MKGYDPTQETHGVEVPFEIGDQRVAIRVTVQHGEVVSASFASSPGYALKVSELKDLPWEKAAREALKSAPADAEEEAG